MDSIRIEHLELYGYHGVFPEEKEKGQRFYVDAELYLELEKAGKSDDLTKSVHYGEVCHFMKQVFESRSYDLIEAAAEAMAEAVLLKFPLIKSIHLVLNKPEAPIGLPFQNVSVSITRGYKKAYLGIGSNLGNKEQYIREAVEKLAAHEKIREVRCSSLIVTKPYGGVEQDDFLNGAVELSTLLTPYELLQYLQQLEQEAHRERLVHWGPRTLDLDILFYEDFVSADEKLSVPHPDMQNRRFVLEPLAELCPWYINQKLQKTVLQMLSELTDEKA